LSSTAERSRAPERVLARRARPAAEREDRPLEARIDGGQRDGAFHRERDRLQLGLPAVRDAIEALHDAFAPRHVEALLRPVEPGHHVLARRDDRFLLRAVERGECEARYLEARRAARGLEVEVAAAGARRLHQVRLVEDLAPLGGTLEGCLEIRDVQRPVRIDAVIDERRDQRLPRNLRHVGAGRTLDGHVGVQAGAENRQVVRGIGEPAQVGDVVEEALGAGARLVILGEPAVEEAAAVIEPARAAPANAVDRRRHLLERGRIDDVQHADLAAGRRNRVRHEAPVERDREIVDGVRLARGLHQHLGIHEEDVLAVGLVAAIELELVVLRLAPQVEEASLRVAVQLADLRGRVGLDLLDAREELVALGNLSRIAWAASACARMSFWMSGLEVSSR
jgi:hypothetical protein